MGLTWDNIAFMCRKPIVWKNSIRLIWFHLLVLGDCNTIFLKVFRHLFEFSDGFLSSL